jgi:hypothetical protein
MRSVIGFLTAPLVPGMLLALYAGPGVLLLAIPLGYTGAALALPMYLLVRRLWRVSFWSCILCGFIAGALTLGLFGGFELSARYATGAMIFALFGMVAGAAFYLLFRLPPHSSESPEKS